MQHLFNYLPSLEELADNEGKKIYIYIWWKISY